MTTMPDGDYGEGWRVGHGEPNATCEKCGAPFHACSPDEKQCDDCYFGKPTPCCDCTTNPSGVCACTEHQASGQHPNGRFG